MNLLNSALVDVIDNKPADFNKKIEQVVQSKLKTHIGEVVKEKERNIMKDIKI